jgi:putative integral membrane protein (TIGR02587 family)
MGTTGADHQAGNRTVAQSLGEYGRGLVGGLLFSLPLLYTAEIWWLGAAIAPISIATAIGATFLLLIGYNRYLGIRRDADWIEVLIDSVEELGLGMVVAALMLWLIGQIDTDMSALTIAARVTLAGLVTAIGVSIGTSQLGAEEADEGFDQEERAIPDIGERITIAACGSVILAASIAPTDEVMMIAGTIGPGRLLGLIALSLASMLGILLYSYQQSDQLPGGWRLTLAGDVAVTYVTALIVSAAVLWFFHRLGGQPPITALARTLVLGVPAALGAAAGRLLLRETTKEKLA